MPSTCPSLTSPLSLSCPKRAPEVPATFSWQDLRAAYLTPGQGYATELWHLWAEDIVQPAPLLRALDQVAAKLPEAALEGFHHWLGRNPLAGDLDLTGRSWITALPTGLTVGGKLILWGTLVARLPILLKVGGDLSLEGAWVRELSPGLRVGGNAFLAHSQIAALPGRLIVGGDLDMEGCHVWNGRIPQDARVGGRVYTDRHPGGVALDAWRHLHPRGEGKET